MTSATLTQAPDLTATDYLVLGLATCFLKDGSDFHQVHIVEPIPSAALETLVKGIETSYQWAVGITLGAVLAEGVPRLPEGFPADVQWCDDFVERAIAAVRTYKSHPQTQSLIPVGTTRNDFNFSLERKRVLNSERIVKTEDNVKQHPHTHQNL
jgi:hypothetical protein